MIIIPALLIGGPLAAGYVAAKDFTKRKLRFVDVAHSRPAPWIAGVAVTVIAAPVVWLLPVVGAASAIALGAGVGLGVRSAQKERNLLE